MNRIFLAGTNKTSFGEVVLTSLTDKLMSMVPGVIDSAFNPVRGPKAVISDRARELHSSLFIVDWHADSLLWNRDLLAKNKRGHVDVPRLIAGNMAVQAFTIVTKMPRRLEVDADFNNEDRITTLARACHWPKATIHSLKERVLYQISKLNDFTARSHGQLQVLKSVADLDNYLDRRANDPNCTATFLGIEGAHALEGDLRNLELFFEQGVRMMAPSHFFDNEIGGSSHGAAKIGLTELGTEMIRQMQAKSMIVDLAHASSATIADVLALTTKPVVVSHTGVQGTCNTKRNLSDDDIKGIAATGGLIGIGYWPRAVCGNDAPSIARAIRYTCNLVGVEHVGLGSDFDGACPVPFDVAGLAALTQALLDEQFDEEEVRLIAGGNALKILRQGLPVQ